MQRKYSISIITNQNAPQIADNIIKEFDCIISEPSIWLSPGSTTEKGLTFIDKKGIQLDSSIFRHQAFFKQDMGQQQTEEKAIEALVANVLFEQYHFEKNEVRVIVTKYQRT